jgi:uncharacterized membrane protein
MSRNVVASLALLVEIAASAFFWGRLPEQVPIHWNLAGEADDFASSTVVLFGGPLLLLAFWGFKVVAYRIDPKQQKLVKDGSSADDLGDRLTLEAITMALLAWLHIGMMVHSAGYISDFGLLVALTLAVFQVLFGNRVGRLRPNFFLGVRTAWTLSSDQVWRKTHRLAGRLLVISGLLTLGVVFLPPEARIAASTCLMLAALLIPALMSWIYFRREEQSTMSKPKTSS